MEEEKIADEINEVMNALYSSNAEDKKNIRFIDGMTFNQKMTVSEAMGIQPEGIQESIKPERLEGEHPYQYKWRRKLINEFYKQHNKGVYFFVASPTTKKGKGKTFRKSNYTPKELESAEITALAKLKGIDLEKIDNK